jgi:hypothetical protein
MLRGDDSGIRFVGNWTAPLIANPDFQDDPDLSVAGLPAIKLRRCGTAHTRAHTTGTNLDALTHKRTLTFSHTHRRTHTHKHTYKHTHTHTHTHMYTRARMHTVAHTDAYTLNHTRTHHSHIERYIR